MSQDPGLKVWCVRHAGGWCATHSGHAHDPSAPSVRTVCGHFVTLPLGGEEREPTCEACRTLHWERGHRCHGLWDAAGHRFGVVGLGPAGLSSAKDGYHWSLDKGGQEGTAKNLRAAKRAVEAHLGLGLTP